MSDDKFCHKRGWLSQAGYSLTEMMIVVGVSAVVMGISVVTISSSRSGLTGDGAMRVVLAQMNQARELAITQRRNMRLTFVGANAMQIIREEVPGPTLTTIQSVSFEGRMNFLLVPSLPDTPEAYGNSAATYFGAATEIKFTPDGTLVDQNGALLNGSVFLALNTTQNQSLSARAVTIFGSTGRVRAYRWNGTVWKVV